jgi:hypothetical protein
MPFLLDESDYLAVEDFSDPEALQHELFGFMHPDGVEYHTIDWYVPPASISNHLYALVNTACAFAYMACTDTHPRFRPCYRIMCARLVFALLNAKAACLAGLGPGDIDLTEEERLEIDRPMGDGYMQLYDRDLLKKALIKDGMSV